MNPERGVQVLVYRNTHLNTQLKMGWSDEMDITGGTYDFAGLFHIKTQLARDIKDDINVVVPIARVTDVLKEFMASRSPEECHGNQFETTHQAMVGHVANLYVCFTLMSTPCSDLSAHSRQSCRDFHSPWWTHPCRGRTETLAHTFRLHPIRHRDAKGYTTLVGGHSRGGGYANYSYEEFAKLGINIRLYTFNSPVFKGLNDGVAPGAHAERTDYHRHDDFFGHGLGGQGTPETQVWLPPRKQPPYNKGPLFYTPTGMVQYVCNLVNASVQQHDLLDMPVGSGIFTGFDNSVSHSLRIVLRCFL